MQFDFCRSSNKTKIGLKEIRYALCSLPQISSSNKTKIGLKEECVCKIANEIMEKARIRLR